MDEKILFSVSVFRLSSLGLFVGVPCFVRKTFLNEKKKKEFHDKWYESKNNIKNISKYVRISKRFRA
jgi:hypothetical protein